jgi:tryptophan halogenase
LESTSIYLIQQAITGLVELFPDGAITPAARNEFNRAIDLEYDRVRDFLILHYHATQRTDSDFWNYVRTMEVPESLSEKIELFRRRGRVVKYREGAFLDGSWIAVYFGQGIVPEGYDLRADIPPIDTLARAAEALRADILRRAGAMPDHRTHLDRYCPMAAL